MVSVDVSALPQLAHDLAILVAYLLVGMSIKYIDQAFDMGVFSKKIATLLAVPTGVLMGVMMVLDPPSASIFLAIALAVAAANKIDNIAFRIGIGLLILIPVFFSNIIQLLWLPFGLLFLAGLADEFGNDWSDNYRSNHRSQKKTLFGNTASFFFSHRMIMKLAMLGLVAFQQLPLAYFPAFLLFDLGYRITEEISFAVKPYRLKNPTKNNQLGLFPTL